MATSFATAKEFCGVRRIEETIGVKERKGMEGRRIENKRKSKEKWRR